MHRHTGHLATGIETGDHLVITLAIDSDRLPVNIGGNAAHHVMAGGNNRNGLLDRIDVGKGSTQLTNAGQPRFKHLLTQMIELELDMITLLPASPALEDLQHHGSSHHIAPRKVFGIWRITLHKALAILINQIAPFATAPLGNECSCSVDACGMKLPHLHILYRDPRSQPHTDSVARIDMCVGGRSINAPRTTGGEYRGLGLHKNRLTGLNADRYDTRDSPILILDEVHSEPLIEKDCFVLDVVLVQGVQQGMPCSIRRRAGSGRLATFPIIFRLPAKGALVYASLFRPGKWQSHVFQFKNRLRAD